jgi:hypothetical protein
MISRGTYFGSVQLLQSSNRTPSNRTSLQSDDFLRRRMRCHIACGRDFGQVLKATGCLGSKDVRFEDCQLYPEDVVVETSKLLPATLDVAADSLNSTARQNIYLSVNVFQLQVLPARRNVKANSLYSTARHNMCFIVHTPQPKLLPASRNVTAESLYTAARQDICHSVHIPQPKLLPDKRNVTADSLYSTARQNICLSEIPQPRKIFNRVAQLESKRRLNKSSTF